MRRPDCGSQDALWLSVGSALIATAIALVLGSAAAFGVARFRFFGREAVSFLLVLPIALPGHRHRHGAELVLHRRVTSTSSMWTIVIGHATFCVVIVYNNVLARLRRASPSLIEASMDLGADGWQTFRFVRLADALHGARLRRACLHSRSRSTRSS